MRAACLKPQTLDATRRRRGHGANFKFAASALLLLAACGQPPAEQAPTPPQPDSAAPSASAAIAVEGWQTDAAGYPKLNQTLPIFTADRADGSEVSNETLRGRWTILGLWPETEPPPDETSFAAALSSAADQDPDLDFLLIHMQPPAASARGWPALIDDGSLAPALAAPSRPFYLLVGPDLTIEAWRGALSATPEDGIKPVIRGVAQIRKQIAAPQ